MRGNRSAIVVGVLVFVWSSCVVAASHEAPSGGVGIAAGTNSVWIWEPDAFSGGAVRFAQCELGVGSTWRCRRGPSVVGRIAAVCPMGRDVIVFFKDGTVRGFAAPRATFGEAITSTSTLQPGLPAQALPFRLASDPKRERVYALTSAEVARQLVRRRVAAEAANGDDDAPLRFGEPRGAVRTRGGVGRSSGSPLEPNPETLTPAPLPRRERGEWDRRSAGNADVDPSRSRLEGDTAVDVVSDSVGFVVLRFEGGAWTYDRAAPEELGDSKQVVAFWAAASGPRILLRAHEHSAIAELRQSDVADASWVPGAALSIPIESTVIAAGFDDDANEDVVAIVERAADGDFEAQHVGVWRRAEGDWHPVGVLSHRSGVASFPLTLSLAISGQEIFTYGGDRADGRTVDIWSAVDGVHSRSFQVPTEILSSTPPALNPIARHAIEYAALAVVLTSVFVWRRERMIEAVVLQPGQMPASLQRRVAAFLVDAIVLAPVAAPTLWWLWGASLDGSVSWEELLRAAEATSSPLFWTGGVFGAEFGVYAAVFEWWMGATPGKRIFGCRVVGDGGAPCRFRDVAIRNAVRVVEFHFTASFLVTLLTPGRQRMGDLLARTLVVERCEIEPTKPAGSSESSE